MEKMEALGDVYIDSKLGITVVTKDGAAPDMQAMTDILKAHKIRAGEAARLEEPLYK